MSDRLEQRLRLICLVLAALFVVRVAFLVVHLDLLRGVRIPSQPHWATAEEGKPTNQFAPASGSTGTNRVETNLAISGLTNLAGTNLVLTNYIRTNSVGSPFISTNLVGTNLVSTDIATTNFVGTNSLGTNLSNRMQTNATGTNPSMAGPGPGNLPPGMPPIGPGSMRGGEAARPPRPLSPLIQARIDKITQSEMLAPIIRPPPMALLGIAGLDAFIRTPSGQTTMLRVNGVSDGIKVLLIGTNRVLIEQGGEKKELTIFAGFGSDSLLPK